MRRLTRAAVVLVACAVGAAHAQTPQTPSSLTGRWALDRAASQFPPEVGFDVDWATGAASGGAAPSGGRGRRSGGGGAPAASGFSSRRESVDDATRLKQLTAEVRTPPATLTIIDTPSAVTVTADDGSSRTFHPTGREETLQLGTVPLPTVARRDGDRLVVQYSVEEGRELRYTYALDANGRLTIDVQFVERGRGDHVVRIYGKASDTDEPLPASPQPAQRVPAAPDRGTVPAGGGSKPAINQQPGGELRGLTKVGIVVEGLTSQAEACGLSESALEAAVAKRLTDAGLTVSRNTDEPTYIYVSVMTSRLPTGLCISRYDAFLNSNTTATLSYQQTPVLVEATLLHKGGLSGGAPAAHADAVLKGIADYVDGFIARIRDANR